MANEKNPPVIDGSRLRSLFDGVNAFGRLDNGAGYDRRAFSDADMAARRWLAGEMEAAGLAVRWDAAGNLMARFGEGEGPVVMVGSHLDTVPAGGAFDGTLGVCIAVESVRALRDAGTMPACPVEIVVMSDEEGRFGGMLGSQAITGQLDLSRLDAVRDVDGVGLGEAMERQGLSPAALGDAALAPGSVKAYLELHVEQGPVLDGADETIGIVEAVTGICDWQVSLRGTANHSGTTPMDARADAFAGLAEIAATIPSIIRIVGGDTSRVTVGKVEIAPNNPHTVPGKAVFTLDVRDTNERAMRMLTASLRALIERVATTRHLEFEIDEQSWLAPVELDQELAATVEAEADKLDLRWRRMASGAGHDAQTMQAFCPSALIFVPSRQGISHAPEEWTDWADVEAGARLYLAVLARLCEMPARAADEAAPEPEPELDAPPAAVAEPEAAENAPGGEGETDAAATDVSEKAPDDVSEKAPDEDEARQPETERESAAVAEAEQAKPEMPRIEDLDFDFDLDDIALDEEEQSR